MAKSIEVKKKKKIRYVRQVGDDHCGAAAVAMCLGVSYAKALAAFGRIGQPLSGEGASNGDVIAAALLLGVKMEPIHRSKAVLMALARESPRGIISIMWKKGTQNYKDSPGGHFAVVEKGMVWCPSAPWKKPEIPVPFDEYFKRRPGWVHTLIIPSED